MGGKEPGFRFTGAPSLEKQDTEPASNPLKKFSLVSFRNTLVKSAVEPIVSLKKVRVSKESTGKLLVFALKVAALAAVRRSSLARCPQVWWGIQGLSLLQVPPLLWLQHWAPLRYIVCGSQVFTKPILFLSIATAITSRPEDPKAAEEHIAEEQTAVYDEQSTGDNRPVGTLALWPASRERECEGHDYEYGANHLLLLKKDLEGARIMLPERIDDDELERFLVAANGNVQRCAALVKRTVRWRETFYFLSSYELEKWVPLVFWHGYDVEKRPSLVIRIGWAHSILKAHERPRFAQAILSQVEYGVANLLYEEDPRITVIIDCEGTPALGFPVHMLKSFCVLMQENYPTRLGALFVVNLPSVVRVIAQAIIQVLKPATKKKIHIEGEQFASALADLYGGAACMPNFLGGSCNCSNCQKAASINHSTFLEILGNDDADEEVDVDEISEGQELTPYHRYNSVLRAIILGFLMLWVIVSLLAGFCDPENDFIPT